MKLKNPIQTTWLLLLTLLLSLGCAWPAKAADITPGYTFSSGEQNITHTKLNNAASGTVNSTFYTGKNAKTALDSVDLFLVYDPTAAAFRKVTLSSLLNSAASTSGATMTNTTFNGTTTLNGPVILTNSISLRGSASTDGIIYWTNNAAAADEKLWSMKSDLTTLTINAHNDALNATYNPLVFTRTGYRVSSIGATATNTISLNAPKVWATGGLLVTGLITNSAATAETIPYWDANKALGVLTVGSGLSLAGGTLSATGGGGSGLTNTFNTDQFTLVDGTNVNFKTSAQVTNIQFYGYADVKGNGLRWDDGSDVILAQQRNGTNLFLGLNGNDIVTINDSFFAPSSGAALNLGTSTEPWVTLHALTLSVLGGITNSALTASRVVYTDANKVLTSASYGPTAIEPWANSSTNMLRTVTNNFSVYLQTGATDAIDMSLASSTNVLAGALTIAHATNGLAGYERTHVRWLWAGGADRAFSIPSTWKTNVYSAVPANITNGTITKMYVTTIGDTSTSANQTNVFVSFEFYK